MKKILSVMLLVAMLITSMSVTAFADSESSYPDFSGSLFLGNSLCEDSEFFGTVDKVTVTITDSEGKFVTVDLQYNEDWGYYELEDTLNDPVLNEFIQEMGVLVDEYIDNLADDDSLEEPDLLGELGYTVTVTGFDGAHFDYDASATVLTAKSLDYGTSLIVGMIVGLIEEYNPEFEGVEIDSLTDIENFGDFIALYEDALSDPEMEMSEEEIAEAVAEIENVKAMYEALKDGSYPGELTLTIYTSCDCPIECWVSHEYYYDEAFEEEYLDWSQWPEADIITEKPGTSINVEDYQKLKFKGGNFKLLGAYDWEGNKIEEPVVNEDGITLRYTYVSAAEKEPADFADDLITAYDQLVAALYFDTDFDALKGVVDAFKASYDVVIADDEALAALEAEVAEFGEELDAYLETMLAEYNLGEGVVKFGDLYAAYGEDGSIEDAMAYVDCYEEIFVDEATKEANEDLAFCIEMFFEDAEAMYEKAEADIAEYEKLKEEEAKDPVEEDKEPVDEEKEPVDEDKEPVDEEKEPVDEKPEVQTEVPKTGDETSISFFALMMAAALLIMKKVRA